MAGVPAHTNARRRAARTSRRTPAAVVCLAVLSVSMAAPGSPAEPAAGEEVPSPLAVYHRLLRQPEMPFRRLARDALLSGPVEILARLDSGEPPIRSTVVRGAEGVYLGGGQQVLCRSEAQPDRCVVDFGQGIARQHFTVEAKTGDRTHSSTFRSFDTHPTRHGMPASGVYREEQRVDRYPPDEVVRLVWLERASSDGDPMRPQLVRDLPAGWFDLEVAGIPEARIRTVTPVGPGTDRLIALLVSAAPYLESGHGRPLTWAESFTRDGGMIDRFRGALETVARGGHDAEYIVVLYAATGRAFDPFRLHTGDPDEIGEDGRADNERRLDALVDWMQQPPPTEWNVRTRISRTSSHWVIDLSSALHTLNDLYLRLYPGVTAAMNVTDGWNVAPPTPRLQPELWPERFDAVNAPITPQRARAVIDRLDRGGSLLGEDLARFARTLDIDDPDALDTLAERLRRLDPGGLSSLHPQREDRGPTMDALLVPGNVPLQGWMRREFERMMREQFGGKIYRLAPPRDTGEVPEPNEERSRNTGATLADMLERVHRQLDDAYVLVAEVPNERADGARHDLTIRVREPYETKSGAQRYRRVPGRLRYMPYYTSSLSMQRKLPLLASTPFSLLRMLAAYELRNHPFDDDLYARLGERWRTEEHPEIRRVLFESWIVANLNRLQAGESELGGRSRRREIVRGSYEALERAAARADRLPAPDLARDAFLLATWYREDFPAAFEE